MKTGFVLVVLIELELFALGLMVDFEVEGRDDAFLDDEFEPEGTLKAGSSSKSSISSVKLVLRGV